MSRKKVTRSASSGPAFQVLSAIGKPLPGQCPKCDAPMEHDDLLGGETCRFCGHTILPEAFVVKPEPPPSEHAQRGKRE